MNTAPEQFRQLRANASAGILQRGNTSAHTNMPSLNHLTVGRATGLGALIGLIAWGVYHHDMHDALYGIIYGAALAFLMHTLSPAIGTLWQLITRQCWPTASYFQSFRDSQKTLSLIILGYLLTSAGNYAIGALLDWKDNLSSKPTITTTTKTGQTARTSHANYQGNGKVATKPKNANLPLKGLQESIIAEIIVTGLLSLLCYYLTQRSHHRTPKPKAKRQQTLIQPFSVWLGHSSGHLSQLAHSTGLAPNQHVALSLEDAAQNILVLGGIGSGKTTRAMHPFLIQLIDQQCGGLIFDIKGDFQKAVMFCAEHTKRSITIIGPGFEPMNLLAGLTPEIAASFLKSTFLLSGKTSEAFWIDTATELCRNTLGILSFLPTHYHLQGLYRYLFNTEDRLQREAELTALLPSLEPKAQRLLEAYWHYHTQIFDQFDEKVKAGVNATIAQVLSPFNHPELVEAFCGTQPHTNNSALSVPMESVLDGCVYLVSLPLSVWGLGGKVVYSLIKLRFYNVMQQRTSQPTWNQERPVFFMCDEFQEIVSANKDGLSDLNFWDKSRSSKTIGIISAQAISSFYAAIGDRDVAHALLQNFRQKICFRTEDSSTLNFFHQLADKVEVIRKTHSQTHGQQTQFNRLLGGDSSSSTENTTLVEKSVLSPQLFRQLQPDQAIALLSVNGYSMDDVIWMVPVFV